MLTMTPSTQHRSLRPSALAVALLAGWVLGPAPGSAAANLDGGSESTTANVTSVAGVLGKVLFDADALEAARVYAYQLADLSLRRATTRADGSFNFDDLPAGLYRVIAHKAGFVPVAVLLTRTSAEAVQFVEVHLARAGAAGEARDDFWKLRGQLPADVLREIESEGFTGLRLEPVSRPGDSLASTLADAPFSTTLSAMTGLRDTPASRADVSQGEVEVRGLLGGFEVGVDGAFTTLAGEPTGWSRRSIADAQLNAVSLRVADAADGALRISTMSNRMTLLRDGRDQPIALDNYSIEWSGATGGSSRSTLRAEYTDESSFYGRGWVVSSDLPDASQTLRLEGSYARSLGDRHSLEAGIRFRQRESIFARGARTFEATPYERLDLFSRGGFQAAPSMLVEYGLYTTLRDGSVSLTPHGGFVLQLGPRWSASTSVAYRVQGERLEPATSDFLPVLAADRADFAEASESEYRLSVTRSLGEDDEMLTISASRRVFGDSLRLYFSDQFFDYLQNLYLVPGDSLPELQVSYSRRLSEDLHTRVESSFAQGGGGTVTAPSRGRFENEIRYFVTSVDTLYRPTSTGLVVAFHRIEQSLGDGQGLSRSRRLERPMEMETLEFALRQDLNMLLELAARWAIRLDAEFSRGDTVVGLPESNTGVRRRFLGGLAVRF